MPEKELTLFQIGNNNRPGYRFIISYRTDEEQIQQSVKDADEFIDAYTALSGFIGGSVEIWQSVKEEHRRELNKGRYQFIKTLSKT